MRDEHDLVRALFVPEFDLADPELPAGIDVERGDALRAQIWPSVWKLFQQLLQSESERLQLLFFHPRDVSVAVDEC